MSKYLIDLFDLDNDNDNITMNIDGKDIEMKPAICYDKVFDKWLVSKCGKVWSLQKDKLLAGGESWRQMSRGTKVFKHVVLNLCTEKGFWKDGSGAIRKDYSNPKNKMIRSIKYHKVIMDTWAPLYDNPPQGIVWEEWEIARDLPSVYDHISKNVIIDHIDDNPMNNHLYNLRRVTSWDNNKTRKAKGI
jgi:hypothetical protein